MLLPKPYLVVSAKASGLLSPLNQRALWWICSVWLPIVPGPWAGMMLICPQSLWLPSQLGTVSQSIHFLCTPWPGLHTSPSFSHMQLPVPPPMALSARSVPLISRLQTTAPHLVLRWCCISLVGTGATFPGLLPSSTPPLMLKAWRVVSCWYASWVPPAWGSGSCIDSLLDSGCLPPVDFSLAPLPVSWALGHAAIWADPVSVLFCSPTEHAGVRHWWSHRGRRIALYQAIDGGF